MASLKDFWKNFSSWVVSNADAATSANVSVVVDPIVNTAAQVVETVSSTAGNISKKVEEVYDRVTAEEVVILKKKRGRKAKVKN